MSQAVTLELCAGSAGLSRAIKDLGPQAYGVDYDRNPQRPLAPIIKADVGTQDGQALITRFLQDSHPDYIHAAPPCGTSTRARERPMPMHLVLKGDLLHDHCGQ